MKVKVVILTFKSGKKKLQEAKGFTAVTMKRFEDLFLHSIN